jgi:hypothetical protein
MSTYKIKMEDKAALLNRLEKAEVDTDSYNITDNKMKGYFEIVFTNPQDEEKAKTILRQSPKINKVAEAIRKLVREELRK